MNGFEAVIGTSNPTRSASRVFATEPTRAKNLPMEPAGAKAPREGSKTSHVIAMLQRGGGTTIEEIMTSMQWQKHTIRALLSAGGSLTRKHGLVITSEKVGDERRYFIKA